MRPSSRVNQDMLMITKSACTSMMWNPNSKACQGASNLYGLFDICQWNYLKRNGRAPLCIIL